MSQLTLKQRAKKFAFQAVTRIPVWSLRALNRFIAAKTEDRAWHRRERFEWLPEVEAMYPEVRREIEQVLQRLTGIPTLNDILPTAQLYAFPEDWRQVMLYTNGQRIEDNCAAYPATDNAIQRIPGLLSTSISILGPGERIPAHAHYYKGLLIFHYAMVIPKTGRCEFRVGDEVRPWHEGQVSVIDPTYEHEVWNESDSQRIVLIGQFQRPDMPPFLKFMDRVYFGLMNLSPVGRHMLRRVREEAARHRAEIEQGPKLQLTS